MIEITHIKWAEKKIGIALHKLMPGKNEIQITAKTKAGKPYYPKSFFVDKEKITNIYGVSTINQNALPGIWIPLHDIERGIFDA